MGPAGLKPEIRLQFSFTKIIIAVNVQLVHPGVLIACSMGTVIKMNTAIAEAGTDLPIILYEITDTGIESDIVPFVKIFIPDTKVPDITNAEIGSNSSFLKLGEADHAEGKKNSKESKFLLHVGWFCIKEQSFLLRKSRETVKQEIINNCCLRPGLCPADIFRTPDREALTGKLKDQILPRHKIWRFTFLPVLYYFFYGIF